jgi:hypothetical protein
MPRAIQPGDAVADLMRDQHDSRAFGSSGELASPEPQPQPAPAPRWAPPAPDCEAEERERRQRERTAEGNRLELVDRDDQLRLGMVGRFPLQISTPFRPCVMTSGSAF